MSKCVRARWNLFRFSLESIADETVRASDTAAAAVEFTSTIIVSSECSSEKMGKQNHSAPYSRFETTALLVLELCHMSDLREGDLERTVRPTAGLIKSPAAAAACPPLAARHSPTKQRTRQLSATLTTLNAERDIRLPSILRENGAVWRGHPSVFSCEGSSVVSR